MAVDLSEVRAHVPEAYRDQFDLAVSMLGDDEKERFGAVYPRLIATHTDNDYAGFCAAVAELGAQYAAYAPVLYAMLENGTPR